MKTAPSVDPVGTALVGCAGWSQISGLPPSPDDAERSQLERYAAVLPAVEINSSFYRSHRRSTYVRWAGSVPADFRFSVKLPRTITHALRLSRFEALLAQFHEETSGLAEKLGCVLVQLPPSLQLDVPVADAFFASLRQAFPCMLACEARHAMWFAADASAVLKAHGITRVIADPAKGQNVPHEPTTPQTYIRLHGSPRIYYSSYSDDYLAKLAASLAQQKLQNAPPAWVIFDNTASGAALNNALAVLDALAQEQRDEDDDGNRHAEYKQDQGTHGNLLGG